MMSKPPPEPWQAQLLNEQASEVRRRYPREELADIRQEMLLWFYARHNTILNAQDEMVQSVEDGEPDLRLFARWLGRNLKHAGERYCRRQKATRAGYDVSDEFFFTTAEVKDALTCLFDYQAWLDGPPNQGTGGRSKLAQSEGNGFVARMSDIGRAFDGLPLADRELLTLKYDRGLTWDEAAKAACLPSGDAARKRVDGACLRMQRLLGGDRPRDDSGRFEGRKPRSNAQAIAEVQGV